MEAEKLKEILKNEYGINNEKEFEAAIQSSSGLNIGIFVMPFKERRENGKAVQKISA